MRKKLLNLPFSFRVIAIYLCLSIIFEVVNPTLAMALTGGPSQPEVSQFKQVGVTDMVDVSTGDFGYNIPLLELPGPNGGYPFNLSYQSGVTMDQEASWVGLGWNVSPGAITRNVRGIPDEFSGNQDHVEQTTDLKPNITYGVGMTINTELFSADFGKLTGSFGAKVYNNSYKGIGIGFDHGVGYKMGVQGSKTVGFNFNFSLDSQEGVGVNTSVSYSSKTEKNAKKSGDALTRENSVGAGIGFHSSGGLNANINGSISQKTASKKGGKTDNEAKGGSSISFAGAFSTPFINHEMTGTNFTGSLGVGPASSGSYPYFGFNGFYSENSLAKQQETFQAYGYMNLSKLSEISKNSKNEQTEKDKKTNFIMDYNREKDGVVSKYSPNLPSPSLTYDYYNISGQGIGGMFRPVRSDYGHVSDPDRRSLSYGGSLGFDVGIPGHYGVSGSFNYSNASSGDWRENNDAYVNTRFRRKGYKRTASDDDRYEEYFFKMAGEATGIEPNYRNYGGDPFSPARFKLQNHKLTASLENGQGQSMGTATASNYVKSRHPRGTAIMGYTNQQIMRPDDQGFNEIMGEFDIKVQQGVNNFKAAPKDYSTLSNTRGKMNLSAAEKDYRNETHLAGITVLKPDGQRYVYGLPAYNNEEVQEVFSVQAPSSDCVTSVPKPNSSTYWKVPGTDEYRNMKKTSRYAHSHLLTSVLGADYVDADGVPGPSDGDYGYWVKFTYVRTSENFKWRVPFNNAAYIPGSAGTTDDDKANYTYGTKEIWYLASAETKTHIAVFQLGEARKDGFGPAFKDNTSNNKDVANPLYSLKEIRLYSKEEFKKTAPVPLQTVHFEYSYTLCPSTINSNAPAPSGQGVGNRKLTLDKVWFSYKNDETGKLSPYEFTYNSYNPPYYNSSSVNDRWGTYTSEFTSPIVCEEHEYPYTPQFDRTKVQNDLNKILFAQKRSSDATAWDLVNIKLPSGSNIIVEYDADDYAYVQHKKAMQMFQMEGIGQFGDEAVYAKDNMWGGPVTSGNSGASLEERRVFFQLENPIPTSTGTTVAAQQVLDTYLESFKKADGKYDPVFAKFKIKLRGDIYDYISGYFDLAVDANQKPIVGVLESNTVTINGASHYAYAYLTLDFTTVKNNKVRYHPFALAAWQYMRINLPQLLTAMGDFDQSAANNDMDKIARIGSLLGVFNTIKNTFTGYRNHCYSSLFSDKVRLYQSFIRLDTPDGFKFGGGSRVRRIYVTDNAFWDGDQIGQAYDYTTIDATGKKISSGVATYEPMVGGEETALRKAKKYTENLPLKTDNDLYFEDPINESFFPAPRVGYSKVSVTSIHTDAANKNLSTTGTNHDEFSGIQLTGKTVQEFYTAKDFPVILEETPIDKRGGKATTIPLPFIGMISKGQLTASQGYMIRLNDMHGRQKSVSVFASGPNGTEQGERISYVEYKYKSTDYVYQGVPVKVLDSRVNVLEDDHLLSGGPQMGLNGISKNAIYKQKLLGIDYDFFVDFRVSKNESGSAGVDFNIDLLGAGPLGFPVSIPWPSINTNSEKTQLAVTNKIVHQSGILDEIIATDGQSTVSTKNLVYDGYSGKALLTTVDNNYNNKIYNYDMPAYLAYSGMDGAFKNVLFEFFAPIASTNDKKTFTVKEKFEPHPSISYHKMKTVMNDYMPNEPTNGPDAFTFAKLFSYLEEGDEFIMENIQKFPLEGTKLRSKYRVMLVEKTDAVSYMNCKVEPSLKFKNLSVDPNTVIGRGGEGSNFKFTLVRSGKRNMLDAISGNIKTLGNDVSEANIFNSSPLSNRTVSTLTPYSMSNIRDEMVKLLNAVLLPDGKLRLGNFKLDDPSFIDEDGNLTLSLLHNIFEVFRIDNNCGGGQSCFRMSSGTPTGNYNWVWSCKNREYTDPYTSSCKCNNLLANDEPSASKIQSKVPFMNFCGSNINCKKNYLESQWPCYTFDWQEQYVGATCIEPACGNCADNTGGFGIFTDPQTGKLIHKGYHIVARFRPGIATTNDGSNCITLHCLGHDKYRSGKTLLETRITSILPHASNANTIVFNYGTNPTTSEICLPMLTINAKPYVYRIKNVLSTTAAEYQSHGLNTGNHEYAALPIDQYSPGIKGIWRPVRNYFYKDERFQGTLSNTAIMSSMVNLRKDGVYDGEQNDLWVNLFPWKRTLNAVVHPKWHPSEVMTRYNKSTMPVESRDAVGVYSAVIFDKNDMLPVAVGKNMKRKKMFFENFDNVNLIPVAAPAYIDAYGKFSFTGRNCMNIEGITQHYKYTLPRSTFSPEPGDTMLFSAWAGGFNTLYSPSEIDARFPNIMNIDIRFRDKNGNYILAGGQPLRINCKTSGRIYEGNATFWRKIEKTFVVPVLAYTLEIDFGPTGKSLDNNVLYGTMNYMMDNTFLDQRACYDDIRIHPYNGLMKTYVYDENDKRLIAESDENNFPALYGYSPSGALTVVKKLTEEGVKTIKEVQSNTERR